MKLFVCIEEKKKKSNAIERDSEDSDQALPTIYTTLKFIHNSIQRFSLSMYVL